MLLFAIGLFLLSFVSAWYFKVQPSTNFHQRILQKYVDEQHKEAAATLSNNELMRKLVIRHSKRARRPRVEGEGAAPEAADAPGVGDR